MAIGVDNLDVILRVIGLRTFQAQMAEARNSVLGVGKAAKESDAASATAAARSEKRAAAVKRLAFGTAASLAVIAGESYKMSIEYQREITMIHTHAGATNRETKFMYDQILNMSERFPQGPIEMAKGMYHLESVGLRGKRALDAMAKSAELAAVGHTDLEETTSALGAVWRAYHGEGFSFNRIVGLLNATVGQGNMRMKDLVAALGTGVLPVFKTAGLTIQDFGGALALLTDEGQHADNAATHLRMTVNLLAAPSKIAQKHLAGIGLNALDLADKMKGPNGLVSALRLLKDHLQATFPGDPVPIDRMKQLLLNPTDLAGLTHAQSQRMNVLSRAFGGARSGATIMALIDQLDTLQQKTDAVGRHAGKFREAVHATMDLPAVRLQVAWSKLQVALIHFGDTIRGPVTAALVILLGAAMHVVDALTWLAHHTTVLKAVLIPLVAVWASYKLALIGVWTYSKLVAAVQLAKAIWGVIAAVGPATAAMWGLDAAMDANPAGVIAVAILALGAAAYFVITHWKQVTKIFQDFMHWIKHSWASYFLAGLAGPFAPIALAAIFIYKHWNAIKKFFEGLWHWLKTAAGDVWGFMKGSVGGVINRVKDLIGWVKSLIDWIGKIHIPGFGHGGIHNIIKGHAAEVTAAGVTTIAGQIPHFATGVEGYRGGFAMINEGAHGETVFLPRGSSVQPSVASSLRQPRAHTPNPAPTDEGSPIVIHHETKLDSRVLYKSVTKYAADRKARKG